MSVRIVLLRPLFLLALLLPLQAADINATLIHADAKVYESLLSRFPKESNTSKEKNATAPAVKLSDEQILQETLLEKLVALSKHPLSLPPIPATVPGNEKEYRLRFGQYEYWLDREAQLSKELASLVTKADVLKKRLDEIVPTRKNKARILTLQLQYAYYRRQETQVQKALDHYRKAIDETPDFLVKALSSIRFDTATAVKRLTQIRRSVAQMEDQIRQLEIQKERDNLLGKSADSQKAAAKIRNLTLGERSLYQNEIMELFIQFSAVLQTKEEDRVFALQHRIEKLGPKAFEPPATENLHDLLKTMENHLLGQVSALKGATLEEIQNLAESLWQEVNSPLFSINDTPISAFKLFVALLILILSVILGALYKKSIQKLSFRSRTITPSTQTLLSNLGFYLIVLIALFTILKFLGINLGSIALIAGALTVGIGFGLQTIVSNFVSGLILMFERSIKIGDYLELDENLRGHVSDIRMRSTTITTNDNIDLIIPNQDLIQNRVVNWTMKDQIRRFRIPFDVAYGTDIDKVEQVVLEAVEVSGFTDIYEDETRRTQVVMIDMGESSVDFELYVWIEGPEIHHPRRTASRFLKLIYKALNAHDIEIPFPQRDLHIRSSDIELPLLLRQRGDSGEP